MDDDIIKENPNPVRKANWLSQLFFWWLNPLFKIGHKRRLELTDMYDILDEDKSQYLSDRLEKEWDKELEKKEKSGHKPSLRNAMIRAFGKAYALLGLVAFFEEATKVVQPLLMGGLIRYFSPDKQVTLTEAYLYAMGVSLCAMVIALTHHPYFFYVQRIGMWLRVAACSLIYKKSLRLSNKAMGLTTTGQIVNLMSNDVVRFDQTVIFLHFLWIGPLQGLAVLIILWYQLGPASLAGFAILLLLIPVQGFMGRLFTKLRRKTATQTDDRVRLMNEILTGMRVIKMYCWEKMFGELVSKVRKHESKHIKRLLVMQITWQTLFWTVHRMSLYAFLMFMVSRQGFVVLTPNLVFLSYPLLEVVAWRVRSLYHGITSLAFIIATNRRVQNFLLLEELEETSSVVRPLERPKPSECKLTAMNITAIWDQNLNSNTLEDISFEVRPGELLAVIGPVGAGKSSLLMALLGELPLSKGSIKLNGRVAYASQQPWVFSATIRQNILFGQPFNDNRYQKSIKAAALTRDLEIIPDGDAALVGERGVSLSGGQKARISLARALYFDADIYLLDDPLSAVDTAVGRHIFDKCICGVLRNKPRVLVTHQLQYLQAADRILILKEGEPMGLGTFDELSKGGIDFAALLKRDQEEDDALSGTISPLTSDPNLTHLKSSHGITSGTMSDHHDVCGRYKTNKDQIQLLSKSLDREYLSVMSETPEIRESLLSQSIGHELSYMDGIRKRPNSSRPSEKKREIPLDKLGNGLLKSVEGLAVGSMMSLDSLDPDIQPEYVAPKQPEEDRAAGTVTGKIYVRYFYRGAGVIGIILFVLLNILAQGTYILADWWLSYWSNLEEARQNAIEDHEELLDAGYNITNITIPEVTSKRYLYIYTGITVSVFLFGLLRALHVFHILVTAAKHLHNKMFHRIIHCPVLFFDTNPVGRILNRFSKDMGAVDETLPLTMYDFIQCGMMIVGIVLVAGIVNPWVFIPTIPLAVLFVFIRRYYLSTSRDIKRLEATSRSPVFSLVSASLQGMQTIRAYRVQEAFCQKFDSHQNRHSEAWYLFLSTSRWFAVRLDWLCALFITAVALCSVFAAEMMNGGLVGLSLTYAIGLMGLFQWGVRQSAEVENQMTSVERIMEYTALPQEAALDSPPDNAPPSEWPKYGVITTENANFRYTDDGTDVLRNLRFCIRAKEKVGIVGRTGAGKSSLIAMLFRLAEPNGTIMVDGINIKDIGLHDLRCKISIIPQDPVLFSGTVRRNLDPFNQHKDVDLWNALAETQLKPTIEELPGCLEFLISEGGMNFSVGQRQLICLARAILKRNRILVIDEATANVDPRTDSLIQETIREKFKECTVLTIAHRLNTIMDSDRVMVLADGLLHEFDEPFTLLQNKSSLFYTMVNQVGRTEFEHLFDIAREAYLSKDQTYDNKDDIVITVSDSVLPPSDQSEHSSEGPSGGESRKQGSNESIAEEQALLTSSGSNKQLTETSGEETGESSQNIKHKSEDQKPGDKKSSSEFVPLLNESQNDDSHNVSV